MKALAWLSLLVVACSKGGERPAAQSQSADTGMADMPGMTATTAVTLTAAQVTHGGVHWEPVALSTVASIATVPGQVIPNEDRTARLGATVRGRVIAVRVRPGDRVSVGRVLVTLQSPEAGMAQSDVDKARTVAPSLAVRSSFGITCPGTVAIEATVLSATGSQCTPPWVTCAAVRVTAVVAVIPGISAIPVSADWDCAAGRSPPLEQATTRRLSQASAFMAGPQRGL